jgi:hypothetical protein
VELLETELVDLRTEKEMWALQGGEYQEMVEILQGKNEELQRQLSHQATEEERKAQVMVKKHESQLSQIKAAYEKVPPPRPLFHLMPDRNWKTSRESIIRL